MGKFVEKVSTGGGSFFSWKGAAVGTTVTGRFVGLFEGNVLNGKRTFYGKFQQADGVELKVNTPTILERRLREEFEVNDILQIVYEGAVKGKQPMPMHTFKISKFEEEETAAEIAAKDAAKASQAAALAAATANTKAVVVAVAPLSAAQVDEAALAAARKLLGLPDPQPKTEEKPPQSKWESLKAVLEAKNPKAASALLKALGEMSPAEAESALENYLKQSGLLT